MQTLKFINTRGYELEFGNNSPTIGGYIFWEIKGLDIPEITEVYSQASGQNGYTLHDLLVEGRTVRLACHIHGVEGKRRMFELRRKLSEICNPLLGLGDLVYTNDYGSWSAKAYLQTNPYEVKRQNIQTLAVSFRCPGGFLTSADPIQFYLAYIEGGLEFALETPTEFGLFGYRVEIDNDGDAPAPIEMHVDGGSLNPVIKNHSTGEFIKLAKQLQYYEKLYINTDPEALEVSLVTIDAETNEPRKVDAYGYLTPDSTLFKIPVGRSAITFNSDDEENKTVKIRGIFRKRFIGV